MKNTDLYSASKLLMDSKTQLYQQFTSSTMHIVEDTFTLYFRYKEMFDCEQFSDLKNKWEKKIDERDRDCRVMLSRLRKIQEVMNSLSEAWTKFEANAEKIVSLKKFREKYATVHALDLKLEEMLRDATEHLVLLQPKWNAIDYGLIQDMRKHEDGEQDEIGY